MLTFPSDPPVTVTEQVPADRRVQVGDEKEMVPVPDSCDQATVSPATEPTKPFRVAAQVHTSFVAVEAQATWSVVDGSSGAMTLNSIVEEYTVIGGVEPSSTAAQ
jgi:hypothetical protein